MMDEAYFRSLSEGMESLLQDRRRSDEQALEEAQKGLQLNDAMTELLAMYRSEHQQCEELKAERERLQQEWAEQQQALKKVIEEQKAQFAELNKISQKTMTEEMLEEQLKPIRKYLMQSRNKKAKAKARIHKVVTEMLIGRELPDDFVLLLNSFDVEEEESEPAAEEKRPLPPELATPEANINRPRFDTATGQGLYPASTQFAVWVQRGDLAWDTLLAARPPALQQAERARQAKKV